jgi:hypothetical protein
MRFSFRRVPLFALLLTLIAAPVHAAGGVASPVRELGAIGVGAGQGLNVVEQVRTAATRAAFATLPDTAAGQSATYEAALAKLDTLAVKGRAPKTGYSRDEFGKRWEDRDRNGCDTRNDILRRDLTDRRHKPNTSKCVITVGVLDDPFTGSRMEFNRADDAAGVQIDHVVALSDAWQKGAQQLSLGERTDFANDPLNLLAVKGSENQKKGDSDAATWLPSNRSFRCQYVATQVDVKAKYNLWVTIAEKDTIARILSGCSGEIPAFAEVLPLSEAGDEDTSAASQKADTSAKDTNKKSSKDHSAGVAPASKTECPDYAPVKGNQGSNGWKYHIPGGRWYNITHPEQCFVTGEDAEAAGYEYAKNQ